LYGSEILSKYSTKLRFYFFSKNGDIGIQNFNKIQSFYFLFHLSKLVQKLWNFLKYFIGRVRDFTNDFWKILKVLFKKIMICAIVFFFKFYGLLFVFYFFIFDILFSMSCICTCQKILLNFYVFLFYGLEILSKNFGKSWNIFQKNIDIWNPKFFINSIVYYLFFFIL